MNEATVYLLTWEDLDRYQSLLFDLPDPDYLEEFCFDGRPKEPHWTTPPVYIDAPRLERPDFWHLVGAAVLVMDIKVMDLLEPHLSMAGELLPVIVSGSTETLYALNILRDIDCLDPAHYVPCELSLRPYFLEHRLPESGLFKLPQTDATQMFLLERSDDADSFRRRVEQNKLRGIEFQRVWSSVDGPEDMDLLNM
jgi:hypothetical protein